MLSEWSHSDLFECLVWATTLLTSVHCRKETQKTEPTIETKSNRSHWEQRFIALVVAQSVWEVWRSEVVASLPMSTMCGNAFTADVFMSFVWCYTYKCCLIWAQLFMVIIETKADLRPFERLYYRWIWWIAGSDRPQERPNSVIAGSF